MPENRSVTGTVWYAGKDGTVYYMVCTENSVDIFALTLGNDTGW